jgi:hypothetical protein
MIKDNVFRLVKKMLPDFLAAFVNLRAGAQYYFLK